MCKKRDTEYTIAGITLRMETPWKEEISEGFGNFLGNDGECCYTATFTEVEQLKTFSEESIFRNQGFRIFENPKMGYIRRFHDSRKNDVPYAVTTMDLEKHQVNVEVLKNSRMFFESSRNDFFHIAWEKILIHENRMILHSACVETDIGGILFSGPSGIGKSTQAELWCRHRNGRLINGDRSILHKAGIWKAYGSPYAGSSRCYVNDSCPVKAIVMLKQAEDCSIRKLGRAEAFCRVFSELTINNWDREYVVKATDLAMMLVMDIPVYELLCTPDRNAVEILEAALRREKQSGYKKDTK